MSTFYLTNLPFELIQHVFLFSTTSDLLRYRSVCKTFRGAIDGSSTLQLRIELAVDHEQPGKFSGLSPAEALDAIRQSRARWKALQHSSYYTIPVPGLPYLTYELSGSVWGHGSQSPSGHLTKRLDFWDLRGSVKGGRNPQVLSHTQHADLGMDAEDFTFDAGQDLLLLVEKTGEREYSVYVRTMSTNQPHPETSAPEFLFVGSREIDRYEVQIAGDTAYMFIFRNLVEDPLPGFDESNMVVVWNWKTGVRLLVCVKIITASEDTHR